MLAQQYEDLNKFKEAADVLQKLHELAPDNPKIAAALARDLMYSDQLDEALKLFQQLAEADPKDWQTQLNIAADLRGQARPGQGARGAEQGQGAQRREPGDPLSGSEAARDRRQERPRRSPR